MNITKRQSDARFIIAVCGTGIVVFGIAAALMNGVRLDSRPVAAAPLVVANQPLAIEKPKVQAEREWLLSLRKDTMLMLREAEKCYWKDSDCADDMDSGAAEYKAKWDEKHDYSDMRMSTHFMDLAHGAKVSRDDFEKEMKRIESLLDRIDERLGEIVK